MSLFYIKLYCFYKNKEFEIEKKSDVTYLTILYALKYINYRVDQKINSKGEIVNEIKVFKIK